MADYQVMPPLTDEEYEALKADIAEHGVQVPVEYDEDGNILDGYHRVTACRELGVGDWPSVIREGLTEDEKMEHALRLNANRRQLSRDWKQEKAKELREQGWTQERIGGALGTPQRTVSRWLSEFSQTAKLAQPDVVIGSDGKQYPATRERKEPEAAHPETAPKDTPPANTAPGKMDVHYSSDRLDWETPQDLFDRLDGEFQFTLDVCASHQTAKCQSYFTREDDGLQQPWRGVCWMNPPYGNEIADWMSKAFRESRNGATVVCLVPSRTDTAWWHDYAMKARTIRFIRGRLRFGGAEASAPFPSAVVVLSPGHEGPPTIAAMSANG